MFQFSQLTLNSGWLDAVNERSTHISSLRIDEFTTTKRHMVIPQLCQCTITVQHHLHTVSMTTSLRMLLLRELRRSIRTRTSSKSRCQVLPSRLLVPPHTGRNMNLNEFNEWELLYESESKAFWQLFEWMQAYVGFYDKNKKEEGLPVYFTTTHTIWRHRYLL